MHVPVVINERGQKLSKQTGASAIDNQQPGANLVAALEFLQAGSARRTAGEDTDTIWAWATEPLAPEKLAAERQPGQEKIKYYNNSIISIVLYRYYII